MFSDDDWTDDAAEYDFDGLPGALRRPRWLPSRSSGVLPPR